MRSGMTAVAVLVLAGVSQATTFNLARVVDTQTTVPGSEQTFSSFAAPSATGFVGSWAGGQGIFTPALAKIADTNTAIPGGSGTFSSFSNPYGGSGPYVFRGTGSSQEGIYDFQFWDNSLRVVADRSTAVPGGSGMFSSFSDPAFIGDAVVFRGTSASGQGIYGKGQTGGLTVQVNTQTLIPGTASTFTGFSGAPVVYGNSPAFRGAGTGRTGIYTASQTLVQSGTSMPGGGSFTAFSHVAGESSAGGGQGMAFVGAGGGNSGVYLYDGWQLLRVADTSTELPQGTDTFASFQSVGYTAGTIEDGPMVCFLATDSSGQQGLYAGCWWDGLAPSRIVDLSTPLDGKTISSLEYADGAQAGYEVYFKATFTDGSSGIYSASALVPEPGTLGVFLLGGVLLTRRGRR